MNGQLRCQDTDGYGWDYCRKNAWGGANCTDRDWDEELVETKAKKFWRRGNKYCRRNAWGAVTCTDRDRFDWDEEVVETQAVDATPAPAEPRTFNIGMRTCRNDAHKNLRCMDSDGYRWDYCRKTYWGGVTCSDNDYTPWNEETAATQNFGDMSDWWRTSTPVSYNKKMRKFIGDNGFAARCVKRMNGRLDCTDDNNRRRYCRYRAGFMTCSDNDSKWDWDAEEGFESFLKEMNAEFMI